MNHILDKATHRNTNEIRSVSKPPVLADLSEEKITPDMNSRDLQEKYLLELRLRVEYWAGPSSKAAARELAHNCLLEELYGNIKRLLPGLRLATHNGDYDMAMDLVNQIDEAVRR